MTTETTKTLKFDTSNLAKKGNPIIPFLSSFSYASLETVNDDWKPQGAYYQDEKLPDVHFNWDDRHLVVNVGPDAIKYIVERQIKEFKVVLKTK